MGIENGKIEMLFVKNSERGKGLGKQLLGYGTKNYGANEVTLKYSLGQPYFASLNGTLESEIAKTFYEYNQKGANFTYTIKYVDSSEEKGTIVWTSKSNEFVSLKEEFEIHVSNGSDFQRTT